MRSLRARLLPVMVPLVAGALSLGVLAPSSADEDPPVDTTPSASPTPTPPPSAEPTPSPTPQRAATAGPAATPTVTLTANPRVRMDRTSTLTATVLGADGAPLAGRSVRFERGTAPAWTRVGAATTGPDGTAVLQASPALGSTTFRAEVLPIAPDTVGRTSSGVAVEGYTVGSATTLTAPASVLDEQAVRLDVVVRTTDDQTGVPARVTLQRQLGTGPWTDAAYAQLSAAGTGAFTLVPRVTASYRVVTPAGRFWQASTSAARAITNLPPGTVVHLPAGAPEPRSMPAQARATLPGAGVRVSGISDSQWSRMTGVSWRSGCPVGRAGLRVVDVNYWAFDGYRRRGRLVVNAHAAGKYAAAFTRLYDAKVPIRRIYPSETFGYSSASHGADDYLAMRSDNTSAFNCRWVTGRPHVQSPHSTGYAVDINTFENPYLTSGGWLPNSWWPSRSFGLIAWRTQNATVVAIMNRSGFAWTYGVRDSQHFDVRR